MIFGHSSKMIGFLFSPPSMSTSISGFGLEFPVRRTLSHIEHEKCLVRFTWSFYGFLVCFLFLLPGLTATSLLTIVFIHGMLAFSS